MSPGSESWFDRLAAPHTRRQGLKAAAAGAVASVTAGAFLARSPTEAKAENASDCRQGCIFTAKSNYTSARRAQQAGYATFYTFSSLGFGPVVAPLYNALITNIHNQSTDEIWWDYKKDYGTCFRPFCPGFDPRKEGGPCEGCNPPLFCNPCQTLEAGYICCIYEPGDPNNNCCPG